MGKQQSKKISPTFAKSYPGALFTIIDQGIIRKGLRKSNKLKRCATRGLAYTRWFFKTFPDDFGFPDFLFECTIILFKTGKFKEAEQKAFETFCANTYVFDKFFGKPIIPIDKWECSNVDIPLFTDYFDYSCKQAELADFSEWLAKLISRNDFEDRCKKYIDVCKRLKTEEDQETRHYLLMQINQLGKPI